jgi:hypothetical protein
MANNDIKNNSKVAVGCLLAIATIVVPGGKAGTLRLLQSPDPLMTRGKAGRFVYQARTEQDHTYNE